MSCKVSFIGLGVMGYPMAGYISKAGHNVTVYNRTKAKAEKWIKEYKGKLAETPMDAAKDCDFRTGIPVDISCPECDEEDKNGQLVERSSRRGTFYACWNYPDCTYNTNSIEPANIKEARPPEEREAARKKAIERTKKRPKRRTRRRS